MVSLCHGGPLLQLKVKFFYKTTKRGVVPVGYRLSMKVM